MIESKPLFRCAGCWKLWAADQVVVYYRRSIPAKKIHFCHACRLEWGPQGFMPLEIFLQKENCLTIGSPDSWRCPKSGSPMKGPKPYCDACRTKVSRSDWFYYPRAPDGFTFCDSCVTDWNKSLFYTLEEFVRYRTVMRLLEMVRCVAQNLDRP